MPPTVSGLERAVLRRCGYSPAVATRRTIFVARARARHALVRIILGAVVMALSAQPTAANASWENSSEIVRGTAQVLEKGEISVGIFAPLQFGLTDTVTVQSHPILDLLQLLNLSVRWRIATGNNWITGLTGGLKYALLSDDRARRTVEIDVGGVFTWFPHRRLAATAGITWAPVVSDLGTGSSMRQAIAPMATIHFIAKDDHLLIASLRSRLTGSTGWQDTTLTAAWVSHHDFANGVDVVLGVTFGDFAIRDPVLFTGNAVCEGGAAGQTCNSSTFFYPVIDLWWRF